MITFLHLLEMKKNKREEKLWWGWKKDGKKKSCRRGRISVTERRERKILKENEIKVTKVNQSLHCNPSSSPSNCVSRHSLFFLFLFFFVGKKRKRKISWENLQKRKISWKRERRRKKVSENRTRLEWALCYGRRKEYQREEIEPPVAAPTLHNEKLNTSQDGHVRTLSFLSLSDFSPFRFLSLSWFLSTLLTSNKQGQVEWTKNCVSLHCCLSLSLSFFSLSYLSLSLYFFFLLSFPLSGLVKR